jgi:hypothetical protein
MQLTGQGRLGIGSLIPGGPAGRLQVNSQVFNPKIVFLVQDDGDVGIGTLTPNSRLEIYTPSDGNSALRIRSGEQEVDNYHLDIDPISPGGGDINYEFRIKDWQGLQDKTVLTLTGQDGYVGIGNFEGADPPKSTLDIRGAKSITDRVGGIYVESSVDGVTPAIVISDRVIDNKGFIFMGQVENDRDGAWEALRGDSLIGQRGGNRRLLFATQHGDGKVHGAMVIDGEGQVGIGEPNPLFRLHVNGNIFLTGKIYTGDPKNPTLYVTGGGGGPIVVKPLPSDIKFKKDISAINTALDKVLKLRGVSFAWKKDEYPQENFPTGRHYGIIAQEAEKIIPEVVVENRDKEKQIYYFEVIPLLIEAVKEQQKEIEELRALVKK